MNHEDAVPLLPWHVNKTLTGAEQRAVQRHISTNAECAKEIEALEQISEAIAELAPDEPVFDPSILADTLARIEDVPQHRPEPVTAQPPLAARLSHWWQGLFNGSATARWALAAQAAVITGLLVTTLSGPTERGVPGTGDATYETVSGAIEPADVKVLFQPDTTEGVMRELLLELEAEVVAGPNLLGLYALRFKVASDREAAISRLRAHPNIVYVERVVRP